MNKNPSFSHKVHDQVHNKFVKLKGTSAPLTSCPAKLHKISLETSVDCYNIGMSCKIIQGILWTGSSIFPLFSPHENVIYTKKSYSFPLLSADENSISIKVSIFCCMRGVYFYSKCNK